VRFDRPKRRKPPPTAELIEIGYGPSVVIGFENAPRRRRAVHPAIPATSASISTTATGEAAEPCGISLASP